MKLSDLKPAGYNPRTIDDAAIAGLGYSIEEFGDLSGIVWNDKTGNLVCGHQRVKAIQGKYGDINISSGKVKLPNGDTFPIRHVSWPVEKEKAANVAANNPQIAGQWTADLGDLLGQIKADSPELYESLHLEPLELDVPESKRMSIKEWDLGEAYIPYWLVLRCPIDAASKIKAIIAEHINPLSNKISIEESA